MSRTLPRHRWARAVCAVALAVGTLVATGSGPANSATTPHGIGFGTQPVAVIPPLAYGGAVPATVSFDGSGSYCLELCSLVAWDWSFGDGSTASGAQVSHAYTSTGLFTATLTVTANTGQTNTATTLVNAFQYTQARMTATPTRGLGPLSVAFDGTGSVTNWDRSLVSYAWNFGDGSTGSGPTVSHLYTTAGAFQASLTVTDSQGVSQTVGGYIFVQDRLAAPANLRATSPSKAVVALTWTNRMVMVESIDVERCTGTNCTSFVRVSGVTSASTSFQDTGLTSGKVYRYRLRVHDYLGRTAVSGIASAKAR